MAKMLYLELMDYGALGVYVCMFVALYFEVVLLISYLERKPAAKSAARPSYYPSVSMLVPCFNEEKDAGTNGGVALGAGLPQRQT